MADDELADIKPEEGVALFLGGTSFAAGADAKRSVKRAKKAREAKRLIGKELEDTFVESMNIRGKELDRLKKRFPSTADNDRDFLFEILQTDPVVMDTDRKIRNLGKKHVDVVKDLKDTIREAKKSRQLSKFARMGSIGTGLLALIDPTNAADMIGDSEPLDTGASDEELRRAVEEPDKGKTLPERVPLKTLKQLQELINAR